MQRADHTTLVVTKSPQAEAVEVHSAARGPRRAKFPYVIALTPGDAAEDQRYVRLLLEDACIDGPACSPEQTCHLGACVDAHVDVQKLTDESP